MTVSGPPVTLSWSDTPCRDPSTGLVTYIIVVNRHTDDQMLATAQVGCSRLLLVTCCPMLPCLACLCLASSCGASPEVLSAGHLLCVTVHVAPCDRVAGVHHAHTCTHTQHTLIYMCGTASVYCVTCATRAMILHGITLCN